MTPRRSLRRPIGQRPYRKMFIISVEGRRTEPGYFAVLKDSTSIIHIHCLPASHQSAPASVLKRMNRHLRAEALRPGDEAWLVVDRDQWTEAQLEELQAWTTQSAQHGLALSNPKFEFWLLLHFEDGVGATSERTCESRLRRHLPHYDKGIHRADFPPERIDQAIARAKKRDHPPCIDWPRDFGVTTVYRLVERIRKAG